VQGQAEIIEVHHLMEPACQLMEQRGQIAVRDDRLRNGQQGAVPVASCHCLSVQVSPCHGETLGSHSSGAIKWSKTADAREVAFAKRILPFFR